MTVSVINATRSFSMDFYSATSPDPDTHKVGQFYSGGVKTHQRAAIHTFDLASVPQSGPPIPANAIIDLAELLANVTLVLGAAWTFIVARVDDDRAGYDHNDATWTEYDAGLPWRN